MSYPDYPYNRIIVNGLDLTTTFRMVLLDGYILPPPEPNFILVDIPGKIDGPLDLTEALTGDPTYGLRKQEFQFKIIDTINFETVKTQVYNYLQGKTFDYQLSMDPGYTYTGSFVVTDVSHAVSSNLGVIGDIKLTINANPFKSLGVKTYRLNATGGKSFRLECGRKPVRPTIECKEPCTVSWKGKEIKIGAGTFRLNDVLFTHGWNEIYINSYRTWRVRWSDLAATGTHPLSWDQARKYRWDDLQKFEDVPAKRYQSWGDLRGTRWSELSKKKWSELDYRDVNVPDTTVYLQYEWKDL